MNYDINKTIDGKPVPIMHVSDRINLYRESKWVLHWLKQQKELEAMMLRARREMNILPPVIKTADEALEESK